MQKHLCSFVLRMLIGILFLSMTVPLVHGQQTPITDASKSAYDFDSLSGVIDADQVDYFSGNWSYAVPLGEVEGTGGMSLPLTMRYSSAVTGTDRLIKLSDDPAATSTQSKGTVTLNNATWVGLGWNLEFGAIRVTGGYNLRDVSSPINHPFSFNLSLVLPDGSHRLVRQLDDAQRAATPGTPLAPTNVYYAENRRFMDIRWNFDRHEPLASTWTVRTVSGLVYTFGAVTISGKDYGMNQTVKGGAAAQGGFNELMPEMVYQWNLAEIRDQAGNAIRFRYAGDGPVTTVRDWARERAEATRSFRNLLTFGDLDPRYPGGITIGRSRTNLTVVKTFNTAHLDTVILAGADGKVVRKVTTETSARPDIHIASHGGVVITHDNYFDTPSGETLPYGHYLVNDNRNYRMYDGLSSTHRLDALTVTDGGGSQVARYAFRYDGANGGPPRPAVASGDNARTLLLEEIAIRGTGNSAGDQLPPYRFTNNLEDSYRITKIVTPTGGELKLVYEQVPRPVAGWVRHINFDESFFDRSRRIKRRIRDADGAGGAAADTTTFVYVGTDAVMETANASRIRRITFPIVDEILPGGHGRIRRNFAGEADLDALGLSARNKRHESERDIRRGLLEEVTWHDGIGAVVQRERTDWQVTAAGTWTGRWQPFYHPGIPQQAYWLRAGETTTTRDGVSTTTLTNHNARNGLVATQTLKSGSRTLRVTETGYHADAVTSSPVTLAFGQPVLDTSISTGDRVHAAFLSPGDPPTASVEAFLNAGSGIESTGVYDFEGRRFSVSGTDVLRIRGVLGTDQLQGAGNMYAGATVTVDWKDGGSHTAGSLIHNVPLAGGLPGPKEEAFDVLVPVPSSTDSARVNLKLHAAVNKPQQAVYRKIRVYARDLEVTAMSADDPEDAFLLRSHILDRPHVVTVKDGSGKRIQADRHRYGRFVTENNAIVMPDTTSAWLDRDSDGQVDEGEWIDRQVATGYDVYGNLTEVQDTHGTVATTVMGYGRMRPVAAFTGTDGSRVTAEVFDGHGSWTDLTSPGGGAWSKTGTGTPVLEAGTLVVNNAVARRNIPANLAGVFEIDVMAGAESEQTAVALAGSGGNDRIQWVFGADGAFRALSGATLAETGASYAANRWYRVKIRWDGSKWWTHVDGARYPASGTYAMASGGNINQVKLSNGAAPPGAAFDNLRVWPASAQPGAMTTWDPVTLDAVAVTDPAGHTERYLRDGLRRVVQTSDGKGRITAQRDHRFSRGIGGTSAYNTAGPNRQTVIAYTSRDGHKDLSRDGHRTLARGTALKEGNALEEGVSLETAGSYVVAAGDDLAIKAGVRIKLTRGFRAEKGAAFRAAIDPLAGEDRVTGSGDVAWNQEKAAKRSVKLGPSSVLETGRVDGHVTARADFHPASASSGKTVIMSFDDGDDFVRIVYDNGSVKLESSIGGRTSTNAFVPGYNPGWPWARVEMELLPTGTVNAWLYGHRDTRFMGASATASVPANWTPAFKANGERGNGYLANLYVGAAEMVTSSFDGLARQIQTRTRAGASDIVTQTNYNRAGKPESLLGPAYLSPSHVYGALARADAAERIIQTAYDDDPLLRVSQVIPPGHTASNAVDTRYGHWGAESGQGRSFRTVDDEKGIRTATVFDAYGRMIHAIADSAGTDAATRNNRTSFVYDALDRLTSTTMPGGGTSRYAYDTLGRMTSRHHPDADGPVRYKYDDLGRVRFSQDARQRAAGTGNATGKITYTLYDDFGRVTRVGEAAATFASLDPESSYAFERDSVSWRSRMTYDDYGDAVAGGGPNYAQGRLVKVEENTDAGAGAEVVHEYAYDHLGNVRVKQVTIDGLTGIRTLEYLHDLAGRVTRLIYPDGSQARYAYDSAGRLARVWDERGRTLAGYTHTAAGNLGTHVVGDNIATGTFTYNAREWVTGIDYPGRFTVTQQYDTTGNVTSQRYRRAASEAFKAGRYEYDRLHRLTNFNLEGRRQTRNYRYDRNGNLRHMQTNGSYTLYAYLDAATPNRVSIVYGGGLLIRTAYNRNGWVTRMARNALTYDYRGLLTGHGSAAYTMDPDRRRVKKTVGTAVTCYLRGADGTVLAEYAGQNLSARYVYAGSRRIARVAGSGTRYYLTDHLGSTRSLVDEEGTVTAAYDYWPYGDILASGGSEETHFRFTGHERDAESNLDYMIARAYAYDVGRFLRPDPMQDEYPGISPYAYANNNPLKFVDPDGRTPVFVVGAITGAGLDIATQVLVDGRSLEEIDSGSVAFSAGAGALGVGVLTKLSKLGSIAQFGTEAAINAAGSVSHQLYETGEVDLLDTAVDTGAGLVGGRAGQFTRNRIAASDRVQDLTNQANRKLRIARNTSSEKGARRRTEQARKLNRQADNMVTRYAVSVGAAVSQAGSSLINWWLSDEEE